jgi:hypothetical protein
MGQQNLLFSRSEDYDCVFPGKSGDDGGADMDAVLKSEIQEIIELVKTVPEPLQLRTLELLLQDTLNRVGSKRLKTDREFESENDETPEVQRPSKRNGSTGLDAGTLPMRVKAFMKKHEVTGQQLERLFHIEGKQYEPIWSLTATKFSVTQVQIAFLQSLQRALTSGEFSFDREEVRTECKNRNSYDKNFKVNFQNNQKYFSGLDKEGLVSLTDEGMKALAKTVTDLARTGDGE